MGLEYFLNPYYSLSDTTLASKITKCYFVFLIKIWNEISVFWRKSDTFNQPSLFNEILLFTTPSIHSSINSTFVTGMSATKR